MKQDPQAQRAHDDRADLIASIKNSCGQPFLIGHGKPVLRRPDPHKAIPSQSKASATGTLRKIQPTSIGHLFKTLVAAGAK